MAEQVARSIPGSVGYISHVQCSWPIRLLGIGIFRSSLGIYTIYTHDFIYKLCSTHMFMQHCMHSATSIVQNLYKISSAVYILHNVHMCCCFQGYLANIWRSDDLIILVHCLEAPRLPTFSLKSKTHAVYFIFILLNFIAPIIRMEFTDQINSTQIIQIQ